MTLVSGMQDDQKQFRNALHMSNTVEGEGQKFHYTRLLPSNLLLWECGLGVRLSLDHSSVRANRGLEQDYRKKKIISPVYNAGAFTFVECCNCRGHSTNIVVEASVVQHALRTI